MHLLVEEFGARCLVLGSLTGASFAFTILHRILAVSIPFRNSCPCAPNLECQQYSLLSIYTTSV